MNVILEKAKKILRTAATLAVAMKDKKVTIPEAALIRFRGLTESVNLVHQIPSPGFHKIKRWDDLTEDEIAFIMDIPNRDVEVPVEIAKASYEAACLEYKVVAMFLKNDDDEHNDLPELPIALPLTAVSGIGEKSVEMFGEIGITSIEQIAEHTPETLQALMKEGSFHPAACAKAGQFVESAVSLVNEAHGKTSVTDPVKTEPEPTVETASTEPGPEPAQTETAESSESNESGAEETDKSAEA